MRLGEMLIGLEGIVEWDWEGVGNVGELGKFDKRDIVMVIIDGDLG